MNINPQIDLILNNNAGGTVSLIEVKSYPHISRSVREQTIEQLERYAQKINTAPLRYYTILSTTKGYIKDIKSNKEIEFDTKPIVKDYLDENETYINPRLINAIYQTWLTDLSLGIRKKLTEPEHELEAFGFLQHIRNTSPQAEILP